MKDNNLIILDNIDLSNKNHFLCNDNFLLINEYDFFSMTQIKTWSKDSTTLKCNVCVKEFSLFNRKHHCRYCGKIFCNDCTNFRINIPKILTCPLKFKEKEERVCCFCYQKLKEFNKVYDIFSLICNLPLNLLEIYKLNYLNKKWKKAYYYFVLLIKNIHQKFICNKELNSTEWNIIWYNRWICGGHSDWILLLIKYIEKNNYSNEDEILKILYSPRTHNCQQLMCNSNCQSDMSFIDAIKFLNKKINSQNCENYILDRFWSSDILEYICFLPVLINLLDPKKNNIRDYLITISRHNYEIANFFFWHLTFLIKYKNIHNQDFYQDTRIDFIKSIKGITKTHLQNSFYFVENLYQFYNSKDFGTLLKSYLDTFKINNKNQYISSPLNPLILIKDIQLENITIKNSCLRPIIIPFKTKDNGIYEIMIKKDDLRKDLIIMNMIKIIDKIIKSEENLDLYITTYNILPITNDFGFIEIVSDATTIYDINKKAKFSILNFILEKNSGMSIDKIRDRFTKSCVSYCLISYILGIGDRHLENIMIRNTGEIFHIDFGFILGHDPKLIYPEIRLTSEMVDAMGGKNSRYYNNFKSLCSRCFVRLRDHRNVFKIMLSSLATSYPTIEGNFSQECIDKFIDKKFMIGENSQEVKLYLINKLDNGSTNYSGTLIDFCHNTLQTPELNSITSYSKKMWNYFNR